MTTLSQGGNAVVEGAAARVEVEVGGAVGDVSAYLLTTSGKVRSDADMVFYNQPAGAGGSIRFAAGPPARFDLDLPAVGADIARIVFCLTLDGGRTFAALNACRLRLLSPAGDERLSFSPVTASAAEAAMMLAELYRHGGGWKLRAVGQGFNGGLAPLARSFGIDIADSPAAPSPPAAAPPSSPKPVNLSKVSLEKRGQTVSLEKRGASFGEIKVNLNWSRGKKGLFGGGSAIDLDLGCLIELADGRLTVVQALGRMFGSYDGPPYIQLSGDDRSGDASAGETLRINGGRWSEIKRIAVFASIYEGVPNWSATNGVVTVTMPDQPPIELRMTEGRNDRTLCGVVLLENDRGGVKATRIVDYHRDAEQFDRAHSWGLRWTAGSKD